MVYKPLSKITVNLEVALQEARTEGHAESLLQGQASCEVNFHHALDNIEAARRDNPRLDPTEPPFPFTAIMIANGLGLLKRPQNYLIRAQIRSVDTPVKCDEGEMLSITNFSQKCLD